MFDTKKENYPVAAEDKNGKKTEVEDENITIHTMQDDLNSLSGIFPKQEKPIAKEEKREESTASGNTLPKSEKYFNPFLNNEQREKINQEKTPNLPPKNNLPESKKNPQNEKQDLKNPKSRKLVWIIGIAVVISGLSSGYYFFFMNNGSQSTKENVQIQEETVKEEPIVELEPQQPEPKPELKYSIDKPNYLPVNTIDPSFDNLSGILLKTGAEIKELNINKPVEFVVTDEKNNPISFPIFAVLAKIKLSSELLKTLDDDFSLFMVNDSGIIKLNLAIKVKDQERSISIMKSEETKLVGELSPLYFDSISTPAKVVFKDNTYGNAMIRYFNLREDHSVSVDYSFFKGKLLIGTSKNSMWMLVDKINSAN
jgi:hypothetical protein